MVLVLAVSLVVVSGAAGALGTVNSSVGSTAGCARNHNQIQNDERRLETTDHRHCGAMSSLQGEFDSGSTNCGIVDTCLHAIAPCEPPSPTCSRVPPRMPYVFPVSLPEPVIRHASAQNSPATAALLNPAANDDSVTVSSWPSILRWKRAMRALQPAEIETIQNDLRKHLQWSTSQIRCDFTTLRAGHFNFFFFDLQSFEGTSKSFDVGTLATTDTTSSCEHAEVALESLLNSAKNRYSCRPGKFSPDCDVACSTHTKAVVAALGKTAIPGAAPVRRWRQQR
jgi:hypothetical protein